MKNALQSNPLKSNKQTLHIGPKGCASFLGREVGREDVFCLALL